MTFGEHLDELRACAIKAVMALAIGFGIAPLPPVAGFGRRIRADAAQGGTLRLLPRLGEETVSGISGTAAARRVPVPHDLDAAAELMARRRTRAGGAVRRSARSARRAWSTRFRMPSTGANLPPLDPAASVHRENLVPLRMYHNLSDDPRVRVVGLSVQEPFSVYIKAAFVVGGGARQPVCLLLPVELRGGGALSAREAIRPHVPAVQPGAVSARACCWRSSSCFSPCWRSCFSFNEWMGIDPDPRITDWLSFVLILPLGFGISFQLPLVMLFLERIGVFTVARLPEPLADRGAGDLRAGDDPHAGGSLQHAA